MSQQAVFAVEYFFQNQREQRHMQLGYTDKMVTPEI